ncbi:cadherin-like domain-containing protein, partial [Sandarakinorhabdus sp.]|uniref:cadherin-like domain-containing protein n=1 Tax=Sandarakinorhabdus sp. TaxID=1916663 RepID=UPI003341A9FD
MSFPDNQGREAARIVFGRKFVKPIWQKVRSKTPFWRRAGRGAETFAFFLAVFAQAKLAAAQDYDAEKLAAVLAHQAELAPQEQTLLKIALLLARPDLLGKQADDVRSWLTQEKLEALGLSAADADELLHLETAQLLDRLKQLFEPKIKALFASLDRQVAKWTEQHEAAGAAKHKPGDHEDGGDGGFGTQELAIALGAIGLPLAAVFAGGSDNPGSTNLAPTAASDAVSLNEDSAVTFSVTANDSDPNGDALAVTAINGAAIIAGTPVTLAGVGTVTLNADGTLTFKPLANYFGTPSFAYTISDGKGGLATGTVNLTVAAVNDAPVVSAAIADQASAEDAAWS